jgi:uncharacterized membrane protein
MKKTNSVYVFMVILFILISLTFVSSASDGGYCRMMYGMYGGYGPGTMLFSWILGILILVALVLLIVWLIKRIQNKR